MINSKRILYFLFFLILFTAKVTISEEHQPKEVTHSESEGKFDIIEKVVDHNYVDFYFLGKLPLPKFPPVHIGGMTIDFSVTKSLFMMILSSVILVIVLMSCFN